MCRSIWVAVKAGKVHNPVEIPQEPVQKAERVVKMNLDVALPAFVEGFHMPADGTPDAYPLRLASKILSDGESSRIYTRLIYDKQIAVQAESSGNFTEDPNLFFVFAVMNGGHTPKEGETQVDAELTRLEDPAGFRSGSGKGQESDSARLHPEPSNRPVARR